MNENRGIFKGQIVKKLIQQIVGKFAGRQRDSHSNDVYQFRQAGDGEIRFDLIRNLTFFLIQENRDRPGIISRLDIKDKITHHQNF